MSKIKTIKCSNPECAQGPKGSTPQGLHVFESFCNVMFDHLGQPLRLERDYHSWMCGACGNLASSTPEYGLVAVQACVREGSDKLGPTVPDAATAGTVDPLQAPTTWRCPKCSHEHTTEALLEQDILNGNMETETGTIWVCCVECSTELTVKVKIALEVISAEVTVFAPEEDA